MNLTLAFEKPNRIADRILATDRLSYGGVSQALHHSLGPVARPLRDGVEWLDENGQSIRINDLYGEQLTYVRAGQLIPHLETTASSDWEKSVVAFVRTLPASTRVVLWWH